MIETRRLKGLYAITDESLLEDHHFSNAVESALQGHAAIIQYRDKSADNARRLAQAQALKQLCDDYGALLIINDDVQLAEAVSAHGVHLGEDDTGIAAARQRLGADAIIGRSCYNRLELALQAEAEGADYVAFGAFYTSPTKPAARQADITLLGEARARLSLPLCAIGGIDAANAAALVEAGADMLAVISGVFGQDDITAAAQHISALFR